MRRAIKFCTLVVKLKQGPERVIGRFPIKLTYEGVEVKVTEEGSLAVVHPLMLFALSMRNTNFPGDEVGRFDMEAIFRIELVQDTDTE